VNVDKCFNFQQFRRLAKKRLPGPIFHYIDGAADDEVTYRRNTQAYEEVDLVPNVLADVSPRPRASRLSARQSVRPRCSSSTFEEEIERAMKLMGARSVAELGRDNLRRR